MKISLNRAILAQSLTFADHVALAAQCGYDGVELDIGQIRDLGPDDRADAAHQLFAKHGVEPAAWGVPVNWREEDEKFRAGMLKLPAQADLAARIGCTRCCDYILPADPRPAGELRSLYVPRFREIAQVLGGFGIRLGLEWVGPRHLRTDPDMHPFIWRMDQLLDLIAQIGEPNVGLLVDSFHWFNAEHSAAELAALRPEQIVYVHINDAPDRPLGEQNDMVRETPGQGIIDLVTFVRTLEKVGYDGCMSTEIFGAELTSMSNKAAALKVKAALDKIVAKALAG